MGKGDDALRIITSIVGKLKPIGGGELQSRAPYRNGDNPGAFNIRLTDGGDTVVWQDHVTGQGGGLKDLIALMPKELGHLAASNGNTPNHANVDMTTAPRDEDAPPDELDVITATPAPKSGAGGYTGIDDYAKRRGSTSKAFYAAGVTEITINNALWLSFYMANDHANPRLRCLLSDHERKQRKPPLPKWKPTKSNPIICLYKFKEALEIARKMGLTYLVMCNGQTSTIVAQSYLIPAFCISDGESKPIPQAAIATIQAVLTKDKLALWVATDNDEAGRKRGLVVYGEFWKHNPQIIEFAGEIEGYDLADHCAKHRAHSVDKLTDYFINTPFNPEAHLTDSLQSAFTEIARARREDDNKRVTELLPRAQQIIDEMKALTPTDDMLEEGLASAVNKRFNNLVVVRRENPGDIILGLQTGIRQLDLAMMGFQTGNAYVSVGETGSGKTQLMASFARALATQAPGVVISMETSPSTFINRMAAVVTRIPYGHIDNALIIEPDGQTHRPRQLVKTEVERVNDEHSDIMRLEKHCHLMFAKRGSKSPERIKEIARDAVKRYGIQWMIIDSYNNVLSPGVTDEYVNVTQAAIMGEDIAVECGIAVFATHQGGRNTKNRADKRLKVHDATGSAHVENKASALFAIYNPWLLLRRDLIELSDIVVSKNPRGSADILINKVRNGGTDGGSVRCEYVGGCGFYNWQGR